MQELSPHALYMRLKRLCGRTAAGKLQVPESIHNQWLTGSRDELLLALTRSLKTHGFDSTARTRNLVRVGWANNFFQSCFWLDAIVVSIRDIAVSRNDSCEVSIGMFLAFIHAIICARIQ